MKAIRISQPGGPEVMQWVDVELPPPGPGQITVRNAAIGLNFIDTYHRSGLYPLEMPSGLGLEGAGTVEAVGPGVADIAVGDRVAYCSAAIGAYSEAINLPAAGVVSLPDGIDFETAAAIMLKGLTTEYLIQRTYPLKPGETCLFHAAAGGVGLIFGQWAQAMGATVIGTAGSEEKAAVARANGYSDVILYREEDVVARVRELTGGAMLPVVYDGVGRDTFTASLDCLRPRGMMVSFGNASGPPPALELRELATRGSLYITRPTMAHYVATPEELGQAASDLFERVLDGRIRVEISARYPLPDAARAHEDLQARRTTGSCLLLPG